MESIATRSRKRCISEKAFEQIAKGDIITYLLPTHMRPTNPLKEWHGRVEEIIVTGVQVSLLDEGYYGDRETVMITGIISVMKSVD
jgi:hypothetical protein